MIEHLAELDPDDDSWPPHELSPAALWERTYHFPSEGPVFKTMPAIPPGYVRGIIPLGRCGWR